MTNDGSHSYTFDAEGNIAAVDGGSTASYVYNALNQRVRTVVGGTATEFVFNAAGQRVSDWNGATRAQLKGHYYWGGKPVAFYSGGAAHFQHQDWHCTERMRTTYNGAVEGSFASLPFGDGQSMTGTDTDASHYATLDHDPESDTEHAQFRQYSSAQGRWLSPDPYYGSYDPSNPQSFNRYVYVLNNPLSRIDFTGLILCDYGSSDSGGEDFEDADDSDECTSNGGTVSVVSVTVGVSANPDSCDPNDAACNTGNETLFQFAPATGGGGTSAPNNNNPFKEWPLNGNITPDTHQQDQKCSAGPVIGPVMDSLPGVLAACQWHDNKYIEYNCNATSWISPFPGPCKAINYMLLIQIYNALPVKPF